MTMICSGCGYTAPALEPRPFRCPNAGSDDTDHVLRRTIETRGREEELRRAFFDPEPDPFIRYRRLTHTWHAASAMGMNDADYVALVRRLGLMIWLEIMKLSEPRLAIASCGNAALAAAVIARAAGRELDVFVPTDASEGVVARLEALGAHVTRCPRLPGVAGDPSYHRFREAVAAGALPFTCQGNENGLVVEGGQTLGWEIVSQLLAAGAMIDRLFVQVGGGALASACIAALDDAYALGLIPQRPRIHAVQTASSPLARAWDRFIAADVPLDSAIQHRSEFMWPWETPPVSVAHGILDDETYDWAAVMRGMMESDGFPIVVSEDQLNEANRLANSTGIRVDPTGSSGLAGVLELRRRGAIRSAESLGVLFTGRSR